MQKFRYVAYSLSVTLGVVAMTGSALAALTAPTSLVMTSASSDTTPTFTWVAPGSSSGVVSSYEVKMDSGSYTDIGNVTTHTVANALAEGSHTFYVRGKEASGTVGAEASLAFSIDSATPTVGAVLSNSATVNTSQNFTATYSDSTGVTSCDLYVDGVKKGAMTLSGSTSGTATFNHTLNTAGNFAFQVRCMDAAGNIGLGAVTTVTATNALDTTMPTVGAISSSGAFVNVAQNFSATYNDSVGVTSCNLFVNGVDRGAMSLSGSTSGTATLSTTFNAAGNYNLHVRCMDAAGNVTNSATTTVAVLALTGGTSTGGTVTIKPPFSLVQMETDSNVAVHGNFDAARTNIGRSCELADSTAFSRVTSVFGTISNESLRAQVAVFAACGTVSTLHLGAGERLGAVASYRAAFGRLPSTTAHWFDVMKIANGRFTGETSVTTENEAKARFRSVYLREANMLQANDKAAVMIMAYGLRPLPRNLNSEAAAIASYRGIFKAGPVTATQWDTVRAIAYSGARR